MKAKMMPDIEVLWVKVVSIRKIESLHGPRLYYVGVKPKYPICVEGKCLLPTKRGFKTVEKIKPGDEIATSVNTIRRGNSK